MYLQCAQQPLEPLETPGKSLELNLPLEISLETPGIERHPWEDMKIPSKIFFLILDFFKMYWKK